jgi:hypothetical protein
MTATRRFSASFAALALVILFAAHPAAAGLADRAEMATTGEVASAPAAEAAASIRTTTLRSDESETTGSADHQAVAKAVAKRATSTAKPAVSRRAATAKKEHRPRRSVTWAPVRSAAVHHLGASCGGR